MPVRVSSQGIAEGRAVALLAFTEIVGRGSEGGSYTPREAAVGAGAITSVAAFVVELQASAWAALKIRVWTGSWWQVEVLGTVGTFQSCPAHGRRM